MRNSKPLIGLLSLALVLALLVVTRAQYSTDLSAFLPSSPSARQQLLVKLLRDGPASQLILVAIAGSDDDTRARLSHALAERLRMGSTFSLVANGEEANFSRDREILFQHRYAISQEIVPEHFTVAGLTNAMRKNLALLGPSLGILGSDLLAHDPTGESQQILEQLTFVSSPSYHAGAWVSSDGSRAVLLIRTAAAGSDTGAQQRAVEIIRTTFNQINKRRPSGESAARLVMSGPGVFAAEAHTTIQREVTRLSVVSMFLIGILLLAVYRSTRLLILGFLPVVSGALAGLVAVALTFDVVYGITLGFGITLIGEAVDYSVYLFIQTARPETIRGAGGEWKTTNWPTVRLGMLTSVCGFLSLLPSAFPGLAQLGMYSAVGLVAAALVTRFVLPSMLAEGQISPPLERLTLTFPKVVAGLRRANYGLVVLSALALWILWQHRGSLWSHELSALNPVPVADQLMDGTLRADLRAPDVRYLVVVAGIDRDTVLRGAEQVGIELHTLVSRGDIAGYDSPSRYLPSRQTQTERRNSLPDPRVLRDRLSKAADLAGLRASELSPFLQDVEAARRAAPLTRADLQGTSLAAGVDALLVHLSNQWTALIPLQAVSTGPHALSIDRTALRATLGSGSLPGAVVTVLDIKAEADALYEQYLRGAIRLSSLGLAAIILLLLAALRSAKRTAKILMPLALSALFVTAGFALMHRQMNIFHLIGLLLIFAIGSNYALFFDRSAILDKPGDGSRTLTSLLVANLATVISFSVLATSSVPVLAALGMTVAPGTFLALIFAAILIRGSADGSSSLVHAG